MRRFIPNFAEIVKIVTNMLKKQYIIKWTTEAKESFAKIKHALTKAPVMNSLDFSKNFLVFLFASKDTIVSVLLQKNSQDMEQPIELFSKVPRDS